MLKSGANEYFPKITIVTVTYNAEAYLEQTIQSVLGQNYPNLEYIIIDGASTDGTVDIIKKYEKQIAYWVSEPDDGIYYAMNKGIDAATGEWINFMNAGDSFCDKKTLSNVRRLLLDDIDVLAGAIQYCSYQNKQYQKPSGPELRYDGMFCWHQAMFTRVEIMKKYKFDLNYKLASDYAFTLMCYEKGYRFKFVDLPIADFIEGGFAESNPILGRIEDMFIQSKYINNMNDIYNKYSYSRLESYKDSNNRFLARILNVLFKQIEQLRLYEREFILYGYGNLGKIIYSLYQDNVAFVVDKNYRELENIYPKINFFTMEELKNKKLPVLITVLGREDEIVEAIEKKYCYKKSDIITFQL